MSEQTTQRIEKLRNRMKAHGIAAVIVPTNGPHMCEYPPERFKTRRFLTGFTGSAGTAVYLIDSWGLWTDGRYYIQAQRQIAPAGGQLFRTMDAACPSIPRYLAQTLPEGSRAAICGDVCSRAFSRELEAQLKPKNIEMCYDLSLAEDVWEERPPLYSAPMWSVAQASGMPAREKVRLVRDKLAPGADALLTARLDSVAWLCNVRADDIAFVPAPVAWSLITPDQTVLFTDIGRIPEWLKQELADNQITLAPYDSVKKALQTVKNVTLQLEPEEICMTLWRLAEENPAITLVEAPNPIPGLKAVKTHDEITWTQKAYDKDCAAVAEFFAELEEKLRLEASLTEYDAAQMLEQWRAQDKSYRGASFAPIVGFRENAAMMHYSPQQDSAKLIRREGFLLVDTGGHYEYGTTDITRTYSFGSVSHEEQEDYTTVVKGFIHLHNAVFLDETPGREIDNLCRVHLWRRLLDYRCGTGHGVGFLLNIHEGPQGFGPGARNTPLRKGMYLTVEPGIYRENQWGIRCENAVYIQDYGQSEYGTFLSLAPFTYLPIDPAPLLLQKLDESEIQWLNTYHQKVRERMLPLLSPRAQAWLLARTQPIR